ncbi:MAG TPA: oxidoreductase [Actinocatenispora sp.]
MRRLAALGAAAVGAAVLAAGNPAAAHPGTPQWRIVHSGGGQFRGLAAVSARVAWVAGAGGVVLRTVDGGRRWADVSPADAAGLEFRDVEATDARHAVALAIGEGDASRIYVTDDGGAHWTLGFRNTDPAAFYDCTAFYDSRHGLAVSDPVDGRFRILSTSDGGHHWRALPADGMPAAQPGEAGFAASGTCLVTAGRTAYLASGGGAAARVYRSDDGGLTWTYVDTGVPSSASAGIFSLAFRDPRHGIAIGGDFADPTTAPDALVRTSDGGRTWLAADGPGEYRSGAAWLSGHTVLAVGPTGSDISSDAGRTWTRFDTGSFDAVQCAHGTCWASGVDGRIALLHH